MSQGLTRRSSLGLATVALFVALVSWSAPTPTFLPDTRYYASMALHLAGNSQSYSRNYVARYTEHLGYTTPRTRDLFSWGLVGPRLVYPTLSAPFIQEFGMGGMLVVPLIAFVLGVLAMARTAVRRMPLAAAMVPLVLYLGSKGMVTYGTSMLTESLALLLVAAVAFMLPLDGRPAGRRALWWVLGLMSILAFTRQSTLIPAGAVTIAYLGSIVSQRRLRTPWLSFALVTTGTTLFWQWFQGWLWPGFSQITQWKYKTDTHTVFDALRASPDLFWKIVTTDTDYMVASDRPLLVLLALAVVAAIVRIHRVEGQLLLGALLATILYSVTNGTPTAFRYGEPGMAFLVLGVGALVQAALGSSWLRTPAPATEAGLAVDPAPADEEVEDRAQGHGDGLGDEQLGTEVRSLEHDGERA